MNELITKLEEEFKKASTKDVANGQKAYMKNQFDFCGIKTPERRAIQKQRFSKEILPPKNELESIIRVLWSKSEREYQYAAQELFKIYSNKFTPGDINLFEFMILHKSWWDTVDFIASKLVGNFFLLYPDLRDEQINRWLRSDNMWLQRTCLLFQLHYKEKMDNALLASIIQSLTDSDEFFIKKAIGWILREYGKTNPEWVREFVQSTPLKNLSFKEAMKHLD